MDDSEVMEEEELTATEGRGRWVDVEDLPLASDNDRYDPIGLLGKGGMGEVRLYRDRRISRYVAYKVLRKAVERDPGYRSRFLLEARVQGQLEHPSIVPVHDLGQTIAGELFFSMRSVRGSTLRQALDSISRGTPSPRFTLRRLLTAFAQVCQTVDFAHTRGVVHRDLKPQNVMLGDYGEVYVLDWGIAKVMHTSDTPLADLIDVPSAGAPTRAGALLGTPKYMAPEREQNIANPQTDVFALGMILGEILAAHEELGIDPELHAIKLRAIATSPSDRYPTARAFNDDLEQYLDGRRDLEARTKLADQHAQRGAKALASQQADARSLAGQEIGRALGLDPQNRVALRTLMQMLTDVPATLPPAAQADLDQRWNDRSRRIQRRSTISTLALLGLVPFMLWMGVRDWGLFALFIALLVTAGVVQFTTAGTRWGLAVALTLLLGAISILTRSTGLLGAVPAGFAVVAIAWRMTVRKTLHGILILVASCVLLAAPLVLVELGVLSPNIDVRDGMLVLLPKMHSLPRGPTIAAILVATFGAIGVAVIFGRLYINELLRAEHKLSFQAWQLQQLIPPER